MADVIMVTIDGNASGLVGAVGQAEQSLGRLEGSASKAGQGLQTAMGVAAVAGVTALGAGLVGTVNAAADFEKQMSAVGAVAGATSGEMQSLTNMALQLGKDTSFSAKEAAVGLEELIKAGVGIEDALGGGARAALDLAAAGAISVGDAAEIASNAMNVFGLKGADMAHVADVIAGAANASAISVNDYKFSLSAAGAVAATVGISFESLSQAIAVMGNAGIKGSDAGTSLKTMMLNLIPTTKSQIAAFQELGILSFDAQKAMQALSEKGITPVSDSVGDLVPALIRMHAGVSQTAEITPKMVEAFNKSSLAAGVMSNKFFDANGNARSMAEIAEVLKTSFEEFGATSEDTIKLLEQMFGSDAIRAGAVLTKEGAAGFEAMAEAMGKVSARDVADERLNNLAGSIEKLGGSAETAAIIFGSLFTPAIKAGVDTATEYLNDAISIIEQLPDAWRTAGQAFDGAWEPSETLTPFMNLVGTTALTLNEKLGPAIRTAASFITDQLVPGIKAIAAPLAAGSAAFLGVVGVAGLVSVAVGGITAALGLLLSPLGLVATAAGLLAAAWTTNFGGIQEKTAEFVGIVQQALTGDVAGAIEQLKALIGTTTTEIAAQLALWGTEFVNWITVAGPPMLAAATAMGADFLAWVAAQVPPLVAQLALWGAAFWEWVAPMIPPMIAALTDLGTQALTWIAAQIPPIIAQLTLWGQEFVAWVAPQIPPLLAALGTLAVGVLGWIGQQIGPILAQLLLWGAQFVAWVAPQIPGLLAELGKLYISLQDWMIAQIPSVTAELAKWGFLFGAWVVGVAIPELVKALPGILVTIGGWAAEAVVEIPKLVATVGIAIARGIVDGFLQAWPTIKAEITNALGSISLPSWLGGGGGSSGRATSTPLANPDASDQEIDDYIYQAAKARGWSDEDAMRAVKTSQGERAGQGAKAVGDGGKSFGPLQLYTGGGVGNRALDAGIDVRDPRTWKQQVEFGLDVMQNEGYGQWTVARNLGYTGKPKITGTPANNGGIAMTPQVSQFALGLTQDDALAACGPAALAWFMKQTGRTPTGQEAKDLAAKYGWDASRGMYGPQAFSNALSGAGISNALDLTPTPAEVQALAQSGTPFAISTGGYTDEYGRNKPGHYYQVQGGSVAGLNVGLSGTALSGGAPVMSLEQIMSLSGPMNGIITLSGQMGDSIEDAGVRGGAAFNGLLVSATTLADGSTVAITQMGSDVTATITNAAGEVVAQYGAMSTGVEAANATLVSTSTDALGNVTTIYTDAAGQMTAVITDAAGNVVNQFGTMQAGVTEQTNLMTSGALTSVTALGDGTLTTVQTMAGTTIATVTDMTGQVTSQSATLANGVSLNMSDMAGGVLTSVTDLGDGVLTTVQDMSGNTIATITDLHGNVTSQVTTMGGEVVTTAGAMATDVVAAAGTMNTDTTAATGEMAANVLGAVSALANDLGESFGGIVDQAGDVVTGLEGIGDVNIPAPDVSDVVDAMEDIVDAAEDAAKAIKDINSAQKGGSKGGGGSGLEKRAVGGPVRQGVGYIVGEIGPELFVPAVDGQIIPHNQMRGVTGVNPYSPTGVTSDGISGDFGRYIVEDITRLTNDRADAILEGLELLHEASGNLSMTIMSTSGGIVTAVGNSAGALLAVLNTIARAVERTATETAKLPGLLSQINSSVGRPGGGSGTTPLPTRPTPAPTPAPSNPIRGVTPGPGAGTTRPVTPTPDPTRGVTPGAGGTRSVRGDSVFEGVISSAAQMYQQVAGSTANMRNVSTTNIDQMSRSVTDTTGRMGDDVGGILADLEEDGFEAFIRKAEDTDDALFAMASNIVGHVGNMRNSIVGVMGDIGTVLAEAIEESEAEPVKAADDLANAIVFKFSTMRAGAKQQIDLLGGDMATAFGAITSASGSGPVKASYDMGAEITKQVGKAISDKKKTDIVDKLVAAVEEAVGKAKTAGSNKASGDHVSSSSLVAAPSGGRTVTAESGPGIAELIAEVRALKATISAARSVSVTYSEAGPPPSLLQDVSILESLTRSGS